MLASPGRHGAISVGQPCDTAPSRAPCRCFAPRRMGPLSQLYASYTRSLTGWARLAAGLPPADRSTNSVDATVPVSSQGTAGPALAVSPLRGTSTSVHPGPSSRTSTLCGAFVSSRRCYSSSAPQGPTCAHTPSPLGPAAPSYLLSSLRRTWPPGIRPWSGMPDTCNTPPRSAATPPNAAAGAEPGPDDGSSPDARQGGPSNISSNSGSGRGSGDAAATATGAEAGAGGTTSARAGRPHGAAHGHLPHSPGRPAGNRLADEKSPYLLQHAHNPVRANIHNAHTRLSRCCTAGPWCA